MFTTRPELLGTFGVVSSTHWLASAAGMAMLERGGNAFDAAVAAGFVLHLAEPHLNGPGGDMPALIHVAAAGQSQLVCGQGVAPVLALVRAHAMEQLSEGRAAAAEARHTAYHVRRIARLRALMPSSWPMMRLWSSSSMRRSFSVSSSVSL